MCVRSRSLDQSIRGRIQERTGKPQTFVGYLVFLPYGAGNRVAPICKALELLLTDDPDFPFAILNCNGMSHSEDKRRKQVIQQRIAAAKQQDKRGIVILTGKPLHTLPVMDWDTAALPMISGCR